MFSTSSPCSPSSSSPLTSPVCSSLLLILHRVRLMFPAPLLLLSSPRAAAGLLKLQQLRPY